MAFVQNDIASYGYRGEEMFANQLLAQNSRGIAMLYPEPVQIVTLAGAGIAEVEDLAGRRVAVGEIGSGTEANARQVLKVHGLGYDDLAPYHLSFADASTALRDGIIDAAFVTAGLPTAAVRNLSRLYGRDFAILSLREDKIEALIQRWPHYSRMIIPGATYPGHPGDVLTVTVSAMLIARADLDPALVERLLEVLFGDATLRRLCRVHVSGCAIDPQRATAAMPIPLHAGAETYYRLNRRDSGLKTATR